MLSLLNLFIGADGAFNTARGAKKKAAGDFKTAMTAVYDWLIAARDVLVPKFGIRWDSEWAAAGFVNGSTGIPAKIEERLGLALALVNFFTANPDYEVPSLDVTATIGNDLRSDAIGAQLTMTNAERALDDAGGTRSTARTNLIAAMRTLIKNLSGKLGRDDSRWLAFGLNMPGANTTPGQPQNVMAQLDVTGGIGVQCDPLSYALRFRWRMRLVGAESKFQLAARSVPPMAVIKGVLPGQTVEIIVQGVNGGSQGVASEPIFFTMPLVTPAPAAQPASPAAKETPASANGNGTNGHARNRAPVSRRS